MIELARELLRGEEAWVVGGAVRDELLGRPIVDLDIACRRPEQVARSYASQARAAVFPLSERHGAWRVALEDGRTVDFTPLRGDVEADLATRDFTINAIAVPVAGGSEVDPLGGRGDLEARVLRAVQPGIFEDDPLRLLRAVRLEDELGFELEGETAESARSHAQLVTRPAGERIYAELVRLSPRGFRRLDELGLLGPLGGSLGRLEHVELVDGSDFLLVTVFGDRVTQLTAPVRLRRYARALLSARRPRDGSAREIHRFRRATEPWALDALAFLDASELAALVEEARRADPGEPLLRGDELGLPPGPAIGALLAEIEEERAAGAISTREEALELVRRRVGG
ncbi:MAG: CCA tRNA nucleotidyltransferase [Actinobacteria bacterium]|nr:CCA tRNA nucleotidyltransferase [Actinomycetota bacterium]